LTQSHVRNSTTLEIASVGPPFDDRPALDGVSLSIVPGVLTGLLGPNGAGKTTLLRILLGVLVPDAGELFWQGHPVTADDRLKWGFMPQERSLYPAMLAGEQLVYFGRLHGQARERATASARNLFDVLGLGNRWKERTDKLSGGMQQRLQLATALVHDPEVIILDEPFAGLDPIAVADLSRLLAERARSGRVVLFSSHQLDLVQDLCEVIAMIDHGKTVLEGAVAGLRASSGNKQLRLTVDARDRDWIVRFPQVRVVEEHANEFRLDVPPGTDPLEILDAARAAGPVYDFGLTLPTLSQLFLAAVHSDTEVQAKRTVQLT
jgi:ABC-2 type transport system ATP-binding protein